MKRMVVGVQETTTKYFALSEEDEKKVKEFSKNHNCSLETAARKLDNSCDIDICASREIDEDHDFYEVSKVTFREVKNG